MTRTIGPEYEDFSFTSQDDCETRRRTSLATLSLASLVNTCLGIFASHKIVLQKNNTFNLLC